MPHNDIQSACSFLAGILISVLRVMSHYTFVAQLVVRPATTHNGSLYLSLKPKFKTLV